MRNRGNLRNDGVEVGEVEYEVTTQEDGIWTVGRLWTSDDNHRKIALASEDLFLDDHPVEITGETHDDGSLTYRLR